MRSRKLALLALLCLASTTVFAQNLGGTWQGTLSIQGNALRWSFRSPRPVTMTELAQTLQSAVLDRPVVNRTGIEGRYDFTLDCHRASVRGRSGGGCGRF